MTLRRYGQWGGNPEGTPEDTSRCIERVSPPGRGMLPSQCVRKRGHGTGGLYCKQHDPAAVKARQDKSWLDYNRKMNKKYGPMSFTPVVRRLLKDGLTNAIRGELQAILDKIDGKVISSGDGE